VFLVQLNNSCFEFLLEIVFISNFLVKGVNEFNSELVESCDDGLEGFLVGEVLFGGELEEGSNEG